MNYIAAYIGVYPLHRIRIIVVIIIIKKLCIKYTTNENIQCSTGNST